MLRRGYDSWINNCCEIIGFRIFFLINLDVLDPTTLLRGVLRMVLEQRPNFGFVLFPQLLVVLIIPESCWHYKFLVGSSYMLVQIHKIQRRSHFTLLTEFKEDRSKYCRINILEFSRTFSACSEISRCSMSDTHSNIWDSQLV